MQAKTTGHFLQTLAKELVTGSRHKPKQQVTSSKQKLEQ
jgi:hypothetical protein